jgi:hypothetical protein
LDDVVLDELEVRVVEQGLDVFLGAGDKVVDADNPVILGQEGLAQVRTDESGAAGD